MCKIQSADDCAFNTALASKNISPEDMWRSDKRMVRIPSCWSLSSIECQKKRDSQIWLSWLHAVPVTVEKRCRAEDYVSVYSTKEKRVKDPMRNGKAELFTTCSQWLAFQQVAKIMSWYGDTGLSGEIKIKSEKTGGLSGERWGETKHGGAGE